MCKSKSACLSILLIYLFASSITFLVLMSFGYNKTTEHDRYFHDIEKNQKTAGYVDIIAQQQPCPTDYSNIIHYEAPGVSTYCKRRLGGYQKGSCDRKNFFDKQYNGMGPQTVEVVHGLHYCGKKSSVSFADLRDMEQNGQCPSKYKLCGKDTKENICFPDHVQCPINDLILTYNQQNTLQSIGYKEQKAQDSYGQTLYVYTTNKSTDKTIPVDFKFGYQQMCVDPEEEVVPKPQMRFFEKDYENECELKLGSYKVDDRYQPLQTANKLRLFQENYIDSVLKNKYDLYDSHDVNYNVTLFQRPILHFSEECRQYFYGNNQQAGFSQMNSKQISHFYGFLVFFYVAFIIIILMSCCMLCANMTSPKSQSTFCVGVTVLMIFIFIAFGMIINIYKQSVKRNESVIKINDMDCGDKIFNSLIAEATQHSKKSNARFFVCMILVAIAIFLYIIYICVYCTSKRSKKSKSSSSTYYGTYDNHDKAKKHSDTSSSSSDDEGHENEYQNLNENEYNNDPYHYQEDNQNNNAAFYN